MFVRESRPDLLTEEGLDAFCVSLNRPVLDIDDLPASPARAAIAVHGAEAGETCLVVALRSIDAGVVCAFTFQGEPHASVHRAMDVGLSFAEGMGFLFDEDMIGGDHLGGRDLAPDAAAGLRRRRAASKAHALWCELIGEEQEQTQAPSPLEEVPLSKFRSPSSESMQKPAAQETLPAQLGRIPIVRRRRKGDTYASADFQTRLLASF